jgi:hypothetical protein
MKNKPDRQQQVPYKKEQARTINITFKTNLNAKNERSIDQ